MERNATMRRRHGVFFTFMKTKIQIYLVIFQIFCTFGIDRRYFRSKMKRKLHFSFAFCSLIRTFANKIQRALYK